MNARELLAEMQAVFGGSFGTDVGSLYEGNSRSAKKKQLKKKGPGKLELKRKETKSAIAASAEKRKAGRGQQREKAKEKKQLKRVSSSGGSGASASAKGQTQAKGTGSSRQKRVHWPFKRSANLGPGPRNSHHDEAKCWRCSCGNIYSAGCLCRATGKDKSCPRGKVKRIKINKGYRTQYNREYHAWRAKQGGAVTARLGATRKTAG